MATLINSSYNGGGTACGYGVFYKTAPNTGTQNWATPGNNNAGDPDWGLRLDA